MANLAQSGKRTTSRVAFFVSLCLVVFFLDSCHPVQPTIAFIPRTSGTSLWEPAHGGAETAGRTAGFKIYWNAPTREDDVQGQIALVDSVIDRHFTGLILAPDQSLALIAPVRRALSSGTPTVVIGSPLPIPAGDGLSYILSNEEQGGEMAAHRIGKLLRGKGTVAILGIDPDIAGIMTRTRRLETVLAQAYPEIKIVEKQMGSFNLPHDQQIAEEMLRAHSDLNAIVALTSASTRGAYSALGRTHQERATKLIGFDDPDSLPFLNQGKLDSIIIQNTRSMGLQAVRTIATQLQGQSVAREVKVSPVIVTLENVQSPEIRQMLSMDWRPRS